MREHETMLFWSAGGHRVCKPARLFGGPAIKKALADPAFDAHLGIRDKEPYSAPLDTDITRGWLAVAVLLLLAAFLLALAMVVAL